MDFRLLSARTMFRMELKPEELDLYRTMFNKVHDPREFFLPLPGEEGTFLNTEIGTNELHLRKWAWKPRIQVYELLELFAIMPTDNSEKGIIGLRHQNSYLPLALNDNGTLTSLTDTVPDFTEAISFFEAIRSDLPLEGLDEDDDIFADVETYVESDRYLNAVAIDNGSNALYRLETDLLYAEHQRLAELYQSEFTINSFEKDRSYLESIGYSKSPSIYQRITWTYNGVVYQLVYIFETEEIFLIHNGLIPIIVNKYSVHSDDELISELSQRSFTLLLLTETAFTLPLSFEMDDDDDEEEDDGEEEKQEEHPFIPVVKPSIPTLKPLIPIKEPSISLPKSPLELTPAPLKPSPIINKIPLIKPSPVINKIPLMVKSPMNIVTPPIVKSPMNVVTPPIIKATIPSMVKPPTPTMVTPPLVTAPAFSMIKPLTPTMIKPPILSMIKPATPSIITPSMIPVAKTSPPINKVVLPPLIVKPVQPRVYTVNN